MLPRKGTRGTRTIITSDNPKAKSWQRSIAWIAQANMNGRLLSGPIAIQATFYLPRPSSLPREITAPVRKPDLDKLVRCLCDALTGVVYGDDSQVTEIAVSKRFDAAPGARIEVREIEAL